MIPDKLQVLEPVVVSSGTDSFEHSSASGVWTLVQIAVFDVHKLMLLEVWLELKRATAGLASVRPELNLKL
jgi:hypothetical protein